MKKLNSGIFCVLGIVFALLASSCASVNSMQTPGVVPKGEIRWAISSSAAGGDGNSSYKDDDGIKHNMVASADPNLEASIRYGAAENFDIGLKLNFLGAQGSLKYQFMRGDFDLALGLELGYQYIRTGATDTPSSHLLEAQIPLLMEYHFNPYVGIAFGPKILGIYAIDIDDRTQEEKDSGVADVVRDDVWGMSGLYVGIMLGVPLRLTEGIWFMPEINVYANAYDEHENSFTHALWQAGVSVFFGGLD